MDSLSGDIAAGGSIAAVEKLRGCSQTSSDSASAAPAQDGCRLSREKACPALLCLPACERSAFREAPLADAVFFGART